MPASRAPWRQLGVSGTSWRGVYAAPGSADLALLAFDADYAGQSLHQADNGATQGRHGG